MKILFILFLIPILGFSSNQDSTINQSYENGEYNHVIKTLTIKENLTIEELILLARSHGKIGEYANGIVYSEQSIEKCLKQGDTLNLLQAINVKTENLVDLKNYEEGRLFCEEYLPYFSEKDSVEYQRLCFKLGVLYYYLQDYEKAYKSYNDITIPKYRELTIFSTNYGLILIGLERYEEALFYTKKSIHKNRNNSRGINPITYNNVALILMRQEKWTEAKSYLDSAANVAQIGGYFTKKKTIFENYYEFYLENGEIKEAGHYLDSIAMVNEIIFNEKLDEKLNALESSFRREHFLKKKIVKADNKLAYYENDRLWSIIIFLISFIIFGAIITILHIRNVQSINQNILIEQKLLRSQMTPHFIFNSLAILQGIILNKEYEKSIHYLSKFSKLLRVTLENSRDKIVPLKDEIGAVDNYIIVQNLGRDIPIDYAFYIDDKIDKDKLMIPPMLIQPFVENTIEHGFFKEEDGCQLTISIQLDDSKLICTIKDNGIGVEQIKTKNKIEKKSLATIITSERLKILAKDFKVETSLSVVDRKHKNEKGTIVTLLLPYKEI